MALYIVPVPIGNLLDITLRAIDTLKLVDVIAAEDTRYSLKLLNHLGIKKKLVSYYKPKEQEKATQIITQLLAGRNVALITDSGTPAISDPGFILIKQAIDHHIEVISLPGPTAFVPALVCSGLQPHPFLFLGFPPRKTNELTRFLQQLVSLPYTLIFYESPRRTATFLNRAASVLGNRKFVVVKELSKKNEKFIRGALGTVTEIMAGETLLGEMVILIDGQTETRDTTDPSNLKLNSLEDLYTYFKETHHISKNQLKKVLMNKV